MSSRRVSLLIMLPSRLIVQAYVSRGARLWLATRVIATALFLWAGADPLRLSGPAMAEMIVLSVFVSILEMRRRHERALLGNLAVGPIALGTMFTVPALVGELAVRLGGAALS